jgi:hypothetical protein
MLSVEILCADSSGWVDHAGNSIDRLVFSKEWRADYVAGHYVLESFGSLYRNIADFRSSPLQSRTDWEIRIPSIYSVRDGSFSTVDLLHWLECANGAGFSLIGCAAVLKSGPAAIYSGVVESLSSGSGTSSIRISDWLGNPEAAKRDFPAAIGSAEIAMWPVKVTREAHRVLFGICDRRLAREPEYWLKNGDGFIRIEKISAKPSTPGGPSIAYGAGFRSAVLLAVGYPYTMSHEAVDSDSELLGNGTYVSYLGPDLSDGKPDNYIIGAGDASAEVLQRWSRCYWREPGDWESERMSFGRDIAPRRHPHGKGQIRKLEGADATLLVCARACAESVVLDRIGDVGGPFTAGSPAVLAQTSGKSWNWFKWQLSKGDCFKHCPRIRLQGFAVWQGHGHSYTSSATVTVNLSDSGLPGDAECRDGTRLRLALKYKSGTKNLWYACRAYIPGYPLVSVRLPAEMDGDIADYSFFAAGMPVPVSALRQICLEFELRGTAWDGMFDCKQVEDVLIGYVAAEIAARVPLGDREIYASGPLENPYSGGEGGSEGVSVKSAVRGLLGITGAEGEPSGEDCGLPYGMVAGGEAFKLRDKLRSLAAESATLITTSPAGKEIILKDMSLQNEPAPDSLPRIGADSIALGNNFASFKMESPERGELLSGLRILWGKDSSTGKYAHELSVQAAEGILADSEEYAPAIDGELWARARHSMAKNAGSGADRTVESEWIASWEGAERMAYNLLRWGTAPLRCARAACVFTKIQERGIDIGSLVALDIPGYHERLAKTAWVVTGRHDDLDGMETELELLEAAGLAACPPERALLLEDGSPMLIEDGRKIKLEDYNVR